MLSSNIIMMKLVCLIATFEYLTNPVPPQSSIRYLLIRKCIRNCSNKNVAKMRWSEKTIRASSIQALFTKKRIKSQPYLRRCTFTE